MKQKLIFDTSAVLNFGRRGGCTFLLTRLAETRALWTTPEVQKELCDPDQADYYEDLLRCHFKLHPPTPAKLPSGTLKRLAGTLGAGEISTILLAHELQGTAVLDDKIARREAQFLGVDVVGTLGILAEAIQLGWSTDDQCIETVLTLHKNGFRLRRPGANETFEEYFRSLKGGL